MITVLIVDDQPLQRLGFRMLLESNPDTEVIGEAQNGVEAVRQTTELRPDVVLMDVRMPSLDGVAATARLTAQADPPKVIILTTYDLEEPLYAALVESAEPWRRASPSWACITSISG